MIGGSGFSKHSSTSSRENRKLRRKKSLFKPERSFLNLKGVATHAEEGEIPSEKLSKRERRRIKQKTAREVSRQNAIGWMIAVTSLAIFAVLMMNFYEKTNQQEIANQQQSKAAATKEQLKKYEYYIASGDDWLKDKQYHNAAFQYRLALRLFPKDSLATLRLISATDLNCKVNSEDCGESERLLEGFVE